MILSTWVLIQIAINILLFLGVWALWSKFRKPAKDDPRLSRGLQLLQSKISVLEDLSDKTDQQVNQIISLLEKKCKELQVKVQQAESEVRRVENSIEKSLEVSKIFEDRIPHQEIIERQKTRKYVQAAQLAHKGMSPEEIAEKVDLPMGEVELIAKMNRDRLVFDQSRLPEWAQTVKDSLEDEDALESVDFQMSEKRFVSEDSYSSIVKPLVESPKSLEKIGEEFRKACRQVEDEQKELMVESPAEKVMQQLGQSAAQKLRQFSEVTKEKVKGLADDLSPNLIMDEEAGQTLMNVSLEAQESGFTQSPVNQVHQQQVQPNPVANSTVEVIGRGKSKVSERKSVNSESIQRVAFPRID